MEERNFMSRSRNWLETYSFDPAIEITVVMTLNLLRLFGVKKTGFYAHVPFETKNKSSSHTSSVIQITGYLTPTTYSAPKATIIIGVLS